MYKINLFIFKYIYNFNLINLNNKFLLFLILNNGDWGLGIGDWGLGIGDWAQSPIPNPPYPIPNPQSPIPNPQILFCY